MESAETIEIGGRRVDAARLRAVCDRYGIAELLVFGSIARGTGSDSSDLDLLYTLAPGSQLGFALNTLEDELSELFGRRVDLVAKKAVHRLLRDRVIAEARPLYAA